MANCKRCNELLLEDNNFCPKCGLDQKMLLAEKKTDNSSLLTVLCTMTIVGSVFTISRALFYEMVSMIGGSADYTRGWFYAGSSVGTIVGAVLMLQKKELGLYIYTVSQAIYILTVLVATASYTNVFGAKFMEEATTISFGIALLFLVPSVVFLILYWTRMVRQHLR